MPIDNGRQDGTTGGDRQGAGPSNNPGNNNPGGGGKRRRPRRRNKGGNGGGGQDPHINRDEMAHDYGFTLAFLHSDDELWHLFNQAVKHTWDAGKFVAQLKETKWFRQNSATARQAITLKYTDPATYQEQLQQMRGQVRDSYGALLGGNPPSPRFVDRIAHTALMAGWNNQQLNDALVKTVDFRKYLRRNAGGEAAQMKLQLTQAARQYGVQADNKFLARNVENILNGNDTIDGAVSRLRDRAMSKYAGFADEIRGGKTVEEIADPYVQSMAQLLEMPPGQIDMFNHRVQSALQHKVDGKPSPMSLYDFEDKVRQDDRWQFTDNAREQYATVTNELLKSFGLRA